MKPSMAEITPLDEVGIDWLGETVDLFTEQMSNLTPSEYNEQTRYLPRSVSSISGYLRYDVTPYLKEIVDCADINSPIREVNVMKGSQIGYTTALESILLYYADYIGTVPIMLLTADRELAQARIENNLLPAIHQSGLSHIIQSSDITGGSRKTGQTKNHLQFKGGGFLIPYGAQNAHKMRSFSIQIMLKDETSGFPAIVGKDGDPDALSDSRCDAYPYSSKIYRGSTPLLTANSIINKAFKKGDQRRFFMPCRECGHMQYLQWRHTDTKTGAISGFTWEYHDNGSLNIESVGYECIKCNFKHYEKDKTWLFSRGEWIPTAVPVQPFIRSYHIPAFLSPVGMRPWSKNVLDFIESYDIAQDRVRDLGRYQVWVNNCKGEPFEVRGAFITLMEVSQHRRACYSMGDIPNKFAIQFSGSSILFLTLAIDVHKTFLSICVIGWTIDMRSYVVEYAHWEDKNCIVRESPIWERVRELIEEKIYTADDGQQYRIMRTFIDAGYENALVVDFCSDYASNVFPTLGRDRPTKSNQIVEFAEFTTRAGTIGFRVSVDHYKDRIATVLRTDWHEDYQYSQPKYLFNAPSDLSEAHMKELTAETRKERLDSNGRKSYYWHRPGHRRNELFDSLVSGHAAAESIAWAICIQHFDLESVDWNAFWTYAADKNNNALFGRKPAEINAKV